MSRRGRPPARRAGRPLESSQRDWLARALGRAGVLDIDVVDDAIREGRVTVGGRVVRQPLAPWTPEDEVRVDGQRVDLAPVTRALMFHKPTDSVTSAVAEHGHPSVFELLRQVLPEDMWRVKWHAIGRLDVNTTGLLLFTNDERLLAHVTAPETLLPKLYVAKVQGVPKERKLGKLVHGVEIGPEETVQATRFKVRTSGEVEVEITEGRHHQVKRMLAAVGYPVTALHRERIGGIVLDVPVGSYRELSTDEVKSQLRFGVRGPQA
jgi:pseudouridine synthase